MCVCVCIYKCVYTILKCTSATTHSLIAVTEELDLHGMSEKMGIALSNSHYLAIKTTRDDLFESKPALHSMIQHK